MRINIASGGQKLTVWSEREFWPFARLFWNEAGSLADEPRTALIADDDEFFRMAVRSILVNRLGIAEVTETASLDEALEKLSEREGVTLALFDLAMPGMESPANLSVVRELFPRTRVVVVSGSQRRRDILMALEAGVHGYVPKGLGVEDLAEDCDVS